MSTTSRSIYRLSSFGVARMKKPGYYCGGGGLYLQVSVARTRSLPLQATGSAARNGTGPTARGDAGRPRAHATQCRQLVFEGVDPIEARQKERAQQRAFEARTKTFNECTVAFIKANRAGWKNEKHVEQWENTLASYASPTIGELAVRDIDTALVVSVLEPIRESKPETASRVRGRIESVPDWATAHHYRKEENPARWKGRLDKVLPVREGM